MRLLVYVVLVIFFASCEKEVVDCPSIWALDRHEITANVIVDSGQLVLTAFAPNEPNAIELIQQGLQGDFSLVLQVDGLVWDTLTEPQFRLEVIESDSASAKPHGIAINRTTVRTYFDGGNGFTDFRLIPNDHIGLMQITRTDDTVFLTTTFGTITLQHSSVIGSSKLDLRMVIGNMGSVQGKVEVKCAQFLVDDGQPVVTSDEFDCVSWK